jgi:hypothetical protein
MGRKVTVVLAESRSQSDRGFGRKVTVDKSPYPQGFMDSDGYERGRETSRLVTNGGLWCNRIP